MTRPTLLAAVGLVAIGVAVIVARASYLRSDGAEPRPASADHVPQARTASPTLPKPLAAETAEPASRVEPPSAEPRPVPSSSTAPLAGADEEPPPLATDTEPGSPHDASEDFAAAYLPLLAAFNAEPRDPTASVEMERAILDRVAQQPGLALTSLEVECRTSKCRVRLIKPNARDELGSMDLHGFFEDFATLLVNGRADPDGSQVIELLLARDAAPARDGGR
jgi:hypothetical protein